ncbi:hypothetical protein BG844_22585 [Couchioplanes caeruleus subsp. caeruleus]|uniref:Uncharacterized protein n=1 Tax=Couchioplanes caeruleus subsp. caeruleus TaxID=56427 RepID=A0A1K0FGW7_9ACTN|nr:hypothetical protein BG844_22585 [Couchioplanes caeruleus subsp. caeruleus]
MAVTVTACSTSQVAGSPKTNSPSCFASSRAVQGVRPVSRAATIEYGQPGIMRCSSLPRP